MTMTTAPSASANTMKPSNAPTVALGRCPLLTAFFLASALLLAGCNTIDFSPLLGAQHRREQFVENQPALDDYARRAVLEGSVYVGMSAEAAEASWGPPDRINRTSSRYGTREQWVYRGFTGNYIRTKSRYLYIQAGEVTAIQN